MRSETTQAGAQVDHDPRAARRRIAGADLPAAGGADVLYQRQPEAVAAARAGIETVEDMRQITLGETRAAVGDEQPAALGRAAAALGAEALTAHGIIDHAQLDLAFDQAAALYAQALECTPDDVDLLEKQADALVNAGRGAEATCGPERPASFS